MSEPPEKGGGGAGAGRAGNSKSLSLVSLRNHVISFKLPGRSQLSQLNLKVLFPPRRTFVCI